MNREDLGNDRADELDPAERGPERPSDPRNRPAPQEELLERAMHMFSRSGFELSTIEAVAASLNMTKRTIYARYKDKAALFEAAAKRAIDRWHIPSEDLRAADTGALATTLAVIARLRVKNNLSRDGIRLQRLVAAEAYRFPEIYKKYEAVSQGVIDYLAEVLDTYREHEPGPAFADSHFAASAFLTMVNTPVRQKLLFGRTPPPGEVERCIDKAVRLFLNGLRPRT